jgi:hypothetical protein
MKTAAVFMVSAVFARAKAASQPWPGQRQNKLLEMLSRALRWVGLLDRCPRYG